MIPGFVISIVTFPGVIVHEIAHQLMCRLFRVAVFDVCYFRFGNPAGYVIHEAPHSPYQNLMIGIGPFLINTIVGALIALPAALPVMDLGSSEPIHFLLLWLGISITMHAFPSTVDAKSIWDSANAPGTSCLARVVAVPIVALIYIGAIGSIFWLDAIYGIAVAMALPMLLVHLLA